MNTPQGVYAFRFPGVADLGLLDLFAVGRQEVRDPDYRWHGLERSDGPLCLFQYTREGAGRLEAGSRTWTLGPGQGFLVDIPSDHVYTVDPQAGFWGLDFILFRPRGAEALWTTARPRGRLVAAFAPGRGPVLVLDAAIRAAAQGEVRDPFEASTWTYRVLVALARHAAAPEPPPVPAAVLRAMEVLDQGWNRPWKLPEVAREVGLSPAHFHRTFRRHTGVTPLEWLSRRRMEKAVELLGAPGARVQAVAAALGFSDTGYFIRLFRRWTGTSPGELLANPSAWKGSKIVLSAQQNTDGTDADPGLS